MTTVPTTTLKNGAKMPMLGFGVYRIAEAELCEASVRGALAAGRRPVQTAAAYGNEGSRSYCRQVSASKQLRAAR